MLYNNNLEEKVIISAIYGHENAHLINFISLSDYKNHKNIQLSLKDDTINFNKNSRYSNKELMDIINTRKEIYSVGISTYYDSKNKICHYLDHEHDINIIFNGFIINRDQLIHDLKEKGILFSSNSNTEIFAHLVLNKKTDILTALNETLNQIDGVFSFIILCDDCLYAGIDKRGINRLSIGKLGNGGYVISSDTNNFHFINVKEIIELEPAQMISIEKHLVNYNYYTSKTRNTYCGKQFIDVKPHKTIKNINVYDFKKILAKKLYNQYPISNDVVISYPDHSNIIALEYARLQQIPYEFGITSNAEIYRINNLRTNNEFNNFTCIDKIIQFKKILLIKESIRDIELLKSLIEEIKNKGAKQVNVLIASPLIKKECIIQKVKNNDKYKMRANKKGLQDYINADSLDFLSPEDYVSSIIELKPNAYICLQCFIE